MGQEPNQIRKTVRTKAPGMVQEAARKTREGRERQLGATLLKYVPLLAGNILAGGPPAVGSTTIRTAASTGTPFTCVSESGGSDI